MVLAGAEQRRGLPAASCLRGSNLDVLSTSTHTMSTAARTGRRGRDDLQGRPGLGCTADGRPGKAWSRMRRSQRSLGVAARSRQVGRRFTLPARVAALLILGALPQLGCSQHMKATTVTPKPTQPLIKELGFSQEIVLPSGCSAPAGVGWDGHNLWVSDQAAGKLWRIDARDTNPDPAQELGLGGLRPGPLVADADGHVLWIVDAAAEPEPVPSPASGRRGVRRIVRVPIPAAPTRPHGPQPPLLPPAPLLSVAITPFADPVPVSGLSWDGTKLWMATSDGLCACVYRIDQDSNGEPLLRFFPRCNPTGLAVDREGKRLWLSAEIGGDWGALLMGRRLAVDGTASQDLMPRDRTQRFVALRPESVRPRGITAAGESVWVLDIPDSGPNRLLRYKVRTGDSW